MNELLKWWREISEYLPYWSRATLLACVPMGEGLKQLSILFHPEWNIAGVSSWGWMIFAMFAAFPVAYVLQLTHRLLFGHDDRLEKIQREIRIMKVAMKDAQMSKAEQRLHWRAMMERLARESQISQGETTSSTTPDASE